jgi:hypothetical protein
VNATSKYVADLIDLYTRNFNPLNGELILPDVFSLVRSSDATFEAA